MRDLCCKNSALSVVVSRGNVGKCPIKQVKNKKGLKANSPQTLCFYGAQDWNRTSTGILPLDPEPSASTNSATWAICSLSIAKNEALIYTSIDEKVKFNVPLGHQSASPCSTNRGIFLAAL